ncbi:S8 family serine peptidase [Castellaniella sp. S9]|uniref:S8 family serine peptidase n=1 Tax=Castellaniella sp. S9 TaxID=2993652 RepID=UPI0022B4ACC8|nr:S8 family serine peptidase [Castellaniella sp. S9]
MNIHRSMKRYGMGLPLALALAGCDGSSTQSAGAPQPACPETGLYACKTGEGEPLYTFQWALNYAASFFRAYPETFGGGLDLNVEPVHRQGIKGQGVNVLVLDSGTDFKNEDLAPNADYGMSWNFVTQTSDPYPINPEDPEQSHGTNVAGMIAAAQNGKGVMGIAPRAVLGAANLIEPPVSDDPSNIFLAYGGADWSRKAHVINASYGKSDALEAYDTKGGKVDTYAVRGLKNLRDGKGVVFVKAAGNDFAKHRVCRIDDAQFHTCENPANDVEALESNTIMVAALNARGQRSSYSSAGPVMWITGMGGEGGKLGVYGEGGTDVADGPTLFTTDVAGCDRGASQHKATLPEDEIDTDFMVGVSSRNGVPDNPNCDYAYMNGTSSAAPTIVGVVALMLSANPDLSWRDVRDILRLSARKVDADYQDRSPAPGKAAYGARLDLVTNAMTADQGSAADFKDGSTAAPLNLGWQRNGAGLEYSDWYGFGVPDAQRAVALAREYARDPARSRLGDVRIPGKFTGVMFWRNNLAPAPDGTPDADLPAFPYRKVATIGTLEGGEGVVDAFQVRLTGEGVCLGAVGIAVRSPAGTVSLLRLPNDQVVELGLPAADFRNYGLASFAFYGEAAAGAWEILAFSVDPDKQDPPVGDPKNPPPPDKCVPGAGFSLLTEARIITQ